MKKLLAALLCLLALTVCVTALAERSGTCGDSITWTLNDSGQLTVSGTGDIPDRGLGYATVIDNVYSIVIEEGITGIGNAAFSSYWYLSSVSLPSTLRRIGDDGLFFNRLDSVTLPDGITQVGNTAFSYGTQVYASIGSTTAKTLGQADYSFRAPGVPCQLRYETVDNRTLLTLYQIDADITSFTVPAEVEAIGSPASSSNSLTSITLPAGLKRIANFAFRDCAGLRSLHLPSQIESIGYGAFPSDAVLYAEPQGETPKALGRKNYSFRPDGADFTLIYQYDYQYSTDTYVPVGLALQSVPKSVTTYTVPDYVEVLGMDVFSGCSSLKTVTLPAGLKSIRSNAFAGCGKLKKLTLPDHVTQFTYSSFSDCSAKLYCDIDSETARAMGAFGTHFWDRDSDLELWYDTNSKDRLTLVGGVSAKATSVKVPSGVQALYYGVFSKCTKLKYVELPKSVESLSVSHFQGVSRQFYIKCKSGSYAEKFARKYGFQYDNGKKKVIGCDITNVDQKVNWIVSNYITSGMSEKEKAQVLHNWLTTNAHYDLTYRDHSAAGVLVKGSGVCDSYSYAYELLCTRAGLANRRLTGQANNGTWGGHAWNLVRIDGQWYHVDATWDDPVSSINAVAVDNSPAVSGMESQEYFLVSDGKIGKNHSWSGVSADNNQVGSYHSNGVDYSYGDCGTFKLTASNHTAVLIVGKKTVKTASIPDKITFQGSDYKVTEIAAEAFKGSKKLTKVTGGSNVKTIGKNAFASCAKLKSVSLGGKLETIGEAAFKGCKALTKITIPAKVKKIGKSAFQNCKKLKSITLKTTKLTSKNVGENAFQGVSGSATVKCPKKKLKAYRKWLPDKGLPKTAKIK